MDNAGNTTVDLTLRLGSTVDLTLRLGLPLPHSHNFDQNPILYNLPHNNNLSLRGPNAQGMSQLRMVNQGSMVQAQQSFNGTQYASAFNQFSGPSIGFASYNTNHYLLPALSPAPMDTYTLIDVPRRRMIALRSRQRDLGIASASGFHSVWQRQRRERRIRSVDPNQRCTNYNCNTNDTPMWRRGPLGPKTLCNACGIKYRKEEERRARRRPTVEP